MTALVLVLGVPARLAIGTSRSISALISLGGIARRLQIGTLDGLFTAQVNFGNAAGMMLEARLGRFTSPEVLAKISASITVRIAVTLIFVNSPKLLGSYL